MNNQPLTVFDWHNAILHLDADAFFVACEQATNPALAGKPVVVGRERGIVTAASYEAKRLGIKRGMRIREVVKLYPQVIIINSDYEKYSLFSVRMMEVLKRFSPVVEQYSIDEAFVDITGLRRVYHCSYPELGFRIQQTISTELGISVSIGISLTKVLAKIASRYQKPGGLTVIPGRQIHYFLQKLPVDEVWGIGHNTASWCRKLGINTALDFARRSEEFIRRHFTKPYFEIWQELNGRLVYPVIPEPKTDYQSISKTQTFTPTADRLTIYAHLSSNLEAACFKARRYKLAPRRLIVFLRSRDFQERAVALRLSAPSAYPLLLSPLVQQGFEAIYQPGVVYRQTGIILTHLTSAQNIQLTIFDDPLRLEKMERLYQAIDLLKGKMGNEVIGSGLAISPPPRNRLKIPLLNIRLS
ncbi:MAG: DNA polymerase Y family protein [candidate division WOR-3 bacterium]|jgi:DNA polymerase-4/DNA polymerase V